MSRVLIMCNTYFQLLAAMQLRLAVFGDDEVDVAVSDHSQGYELVLQNLERTGLFDKTMRLETKEWLYASGIKGKIGHVIDALTSRHKAPIHEKYDHILFYNCALDVCALMDLYASQGYEAEWSWFEEGLLSYESDVSSQWGKSVQIANAKHRLLHGHTYDSLISSYYCFFPSMKLTTAPGVELRAIPPISQTQQQLVPLLKAVFDIDGFSCPQRYIYFASSSDVDGTPFGETELVLKIAELVGPQNLLVKMHPRDERTVYQDAGIAVMQNSYVPWEVMQLIGDVAGKTLITSVSGSFISISAMMQPAPRSLFVFAPAAGNEWYCARAAYIADVVERLHVLDLCPNIQAIPLATLEEALGCGQQTAGGAQA